MASIKQPAKQATHGRPPALATAQLCTPAQCRIGQALLRGQWREAVRQLLTPRPDFTRPEQAEAARLYLEDGDIEGALARMPRFLVAEPTLLQVGDGGEAVRWLLWKTDGNASRATAAGGLHRAHWPVCLPALHACMQAVPASLFSSFCVIRRC